MNMTRTLIMALAFALSGCNGEAPSTQAGESATDGDRQEERNMSMDPQLEPAASAAVSDLARRLEIDEAEIALAEAEFVTWPNSALGCPEPDMMYSQALVPGYRIRLIVDGTSYHYHGANDKPPLHCPADRVGDPAATGSEESKDAR